MPHTIFAVEERRHHHQESSECRLVEQSTVGVRRAHSERALTGVTQTLRQADHEQVHG